MHKKKENRQISNEKKTIETMISMYCKSTHNGRDTLCQECNDLYQYCMERLDHCPWATQKPTCAKCTIHCYAPSYRAQIKRVMRHAGPRMIFTHPILALRHILHTFHSSAVNR